jgi:homoserine O-acetyltransferase/O-succinyltransferase
METHHFKYTFDFSLESGETLHGFELAYTTWGKLNAAKNNVIWVCHALTANANPAEWWAGLVGEKDFFNPEEHFIVCANMLGSCYGSTGALSINPKSGEPYYADFPTTTVRDMARALDLLSRNLGILRIHTCIGGSMGGQQALEWAVLQPELIENLVLIATNARHSPWGIAFNESQRLAIYADQTWAERRENAGQAGLKAARSIALLSYRHAEAYNFSQWEEDEDKTSNFKAASYQQYQGQKLVNRFNVFSYITLLNAMDTHNIGRGRGGAEKALATIQAKTLVIGIKSDLLFPTQEQVFLACNIKNATYKEIGSDYGHDGFLIETEKITYLLEFFFKTITVSVVSSPPQQVQQLANPILRMAV